MSAPIAPDATTRVERFVVQQLLENLDGLSFADLWQLIHRQPGYASPLLSRAVNALEKRGRIAYRIVSAFPDHARGLYYLHATGWLKAIRAEMAHVNG